MGRSRILYTAALFAALAPNVACAAEPPPRPPNPASAGTPAPKTAEAPLPRLFGEPAALADGASLQAKDADSRMVLWLLGRESATGFVAAGGEPIRGVANAANRATLFDALAAKGGGLTVSRIGAGTAKPVRVEEADIAFPMLLDRLFAPSGASGVVFAHGVPLTGVSVLAHDVPADAVIASLAAATNTRIVKGRNLLFVLPTDVALADLPSKKPGPAFSLRVAGAAPAEVVALLEAAGIAVEGRVPCEAGQTIWLDAQEVRSDEAMRAIRLASGAGDLIGNGDACKPKVWSSSKMAEIAGATPIAVVRAGSRAAALVRVGTETWIVGEERLPPSQRLVPAGAPALLLKKGGAPWGDTALAAWPQRASDSRVRMATAVSGDAIVNGVLRATVVDARRKGALIEDATGLLLVPSDGAFGDRTLVVEDGRVTLGAAADAVVLSIVPVPSAPPPESETASANEGEDADEPGGGSPFQNGEVRAGINDKLVKDVKTPKGSSSSGPPKEEVSVASSEMPSPTLQAASKRRANQAESFSPQDPSGGVLWAVEPFREKAAWLGASEKALAAKFRGDSWGDAFALALEAALRARGRNAHAVAKPLSEAQIKTLVEKEKLRFLVDGELRSLVATKGSAALAVNVRVRKQTAAKLLVVSSRTMDASLPLAGAAPTDADLLALFRLAAEKAADSVVDSIPQDLFAIRN